MLDSWRLKIFCTVAQTGSFTAAAGRLNLTQSAISQQIALLERDVGAALLQRLPRGLKLTEIGRLLAERARPLLEGMADLEHQLRRAATASAPIRIGVFSTAGAHIVPMLVQKYRQQNPESTLVIRECRPERLEAELSEGLVDVGLSWDYDFLDRAFVGLFRRHLLDDPMYLLLPNGHPLVGQKGPLRLADLAHEQWVVRTHTFPPFDTAFELICRRAGFEPNIVFRSQDYQAAQGLVAAGVGVAVAPRLALTALRHDVSARLLTEPKLVRRIEAVGLPSAGSDPRIILLLNMLYDLLAEMQSSSRKPDALVTVANATTPQPRSGS